MRHFVPALVLSALALTALALSRPGRAQGEPPAAEAVTAADTALRAVHFADHNEGWAAGDEGVIWHTIDGGQTWERQTTGTRASLRALHFFDAFAGFAVGCEAQPFGRAGRGVVLYTRDGGAAWIRATTAVLPALHAVWFRDRRTGYLAGEPSDQCPTGLLGTNDGGITWTPLPGPAPLGWHALHDGIAVGPNGQVGLLGPAGLQLITVEAAQGRPLRAVTKVGTTYWAVGDAGLAITSGDGGRTWAAAPLGLAPEVPRHWDFRTVGFSGNHGWIAGRPGSAVLHTADQGKTWKALPTGQPLPLHAAHLADGQRGWAVGELGTILHTRDGGRAWQAQHRGGERLAVLGVVGRPEALPLGALAALGGDGEAGYLCGAIRAVAADGNPVGEEGRWAEAVRLAGAAAGETLTQFALPQHLAAAPAAQVARYWGNSNDEARGFGLLERQIVLALRLWRPDVVIGEHPDHRASGQTGALLALALKRAFTRAGQADVYPEQLAQLGLQPWSPSKLYALAAPGESVGVVIDGQVAVPGLFGTPQTFTAPAARLLLANPTAVPPAQGFKLIEATLEGAAQHKHLVQGLTLEAGGPARRPRRQGADDAAFTALQQAARERRDALAAARQQVQTPARAHQFLTQVDRQLRGLPAEQAAEAAYTLGDLHVRMGQWLLAREMFLYLAERHPQHPLTAEACRWLMRLGASSEARRREELKQFQSVQRLSPDGNQATGLRIDQTNALLRRPEDLRQWARGCLVIGETLGTLDPAVATDPAVQFCLAAARRATGALDQAEQWYAECGANFPPGPWRDAAATEIWVGRRAGVPPRPVITCPAAATRPRLDAVFDDDCWKDAPAVALKDAVGQTAERFLTKARLTHDAEFLYLALECSHPDDQPQVPPVRPRRHDDDLRPFDRVSLLLDLDRDYATYFRLEVDQRGCVAEDCWGDSRWNPTWYVAVASDATGWRIEAALPWVELTAEPPKPGQAWCANLVRIIPGKGVQALSLPADVVPRPEGLGLLLFAEAEGKK